jgi:hypothetical protein
MASPTDEASESSTAIAAPPAVGPSRAGHPSRLNQALAWVGIVAGGLFIVAAIFFSGFFLSWSFGGHGDGHMGPGTMACCRQMKPGEQMMKPDEHMKPGAMMPPGSQMTPGEMTPRGMMGPDGMMGPEVHSPATTAPSSPRP